MITVQIITDSISSDGIRLTTLQCRYPRFIHSQVKTHRAFSTNSGSSRARPVASRADDMVYPLVWTADQAGMIGGEELTGDQLVACKMAWDHAAESCRRVANIMATHGLHKQYASRPLEWFGHIDTLITSTYWANFFAQREIPHAGAQPEMQALAEAIRDAMNESDPMLLLRDRWHLPFVTDGDRVKFGAESLKLISAGRCAAISYREFDDSSSQKAIDRALKMISAKPMHPSPFEHQGTPDTMRADGTWWNSDKHGNFTGWIQFRHMLPNNTALDR